MHLPASMHRGHTDASRGRASWRLALIHRRFLSTLAGRPMHQAAGVF